MKLVINSHIKSNVALEHLLESLKSCEEFTNYEIVVCIGGYYDNKDYEISKNENVTIIKCNHNSIDLTGLITLYELYKDDIHEHYLYLHDTCKVGDNFYKKLSKISLENVSTIRINKGPSMNIGIYSQQIINKYSDFLIANKNVKESEIMRFKSLNIKYEDYIFKSDKNNIVLDNYNGHNYTGPTDYYGSGVMRIVEYYPNLDLFKIKANWGGSKNWVLDN